MVQGGSDELELLLISQSVDVETGYLALKLLVEATLSVI
jgi:hypothetical protein